MQPAQPAQAPGTAASSNAGSSATNPPASTGASNMNAPATAQSATSNPPATAQSGAQAGHFMTAMQGSQMLASKIIGTTVVSANNESIGDVNDVVLDSNGQVLAVVIGVGGFLGIGEKNVAVPYSSLQFASRDQINAMNNQKPDSSASGTTAMPNSNVSATGSTATTVGSNGAPDRVVLAMTKDQLKAAPSFHTSARSGDSPAGAGTGANPAPKQ
jgi:sporulation protein YlmC with PRC-barrel domain